MIVFAIVGVAVKADIALPIYSSQGPINPKPNPTSEDSLQTLNPKSQQKTTLYNDLTAGSVKNPASLSVTEKS